MARRVTWTNNSTSYDGTNIYRDTTIDPQSLPAPIATVGPVAQGATVEYIDLDSLAAGDYEYAVQDFDGQGVGALSAVEKHTVPEDFASAEVGDEIGGGVYAGKITYADSREFHIVVAKLAAQTQAMWKTSRTATSGTSDLDDGTANTDSMEAAGISDHPAAQHCVNLDEGGKTDWHFPARNEARLVYDNLYETELANFSDSTAYVWSSSQSTDNDTFAWMIYLPNGIATTTDNHKDTARDVWPVRRVPV